MRRSEPTLNSFTDPTQYKRLAGLQAMLQMLTDWDAEVRLAGAESLGRLGDARANEILTDALGDRSEWVRQAAGEALRRIGGEAPRAGAPSSPVEGKLG